MMYLVILVAFTAGMGTYALIVAEIAHRQDQQWANRRKGTL